MSEILSEFISSLEETEKAIRNSNVKNNGSINVAYGNWTLAPIYISDIASYIDTFINRFKKIKPENLSQSTIDKIEGYQLTINDLNLYITNHFDNNVNNLQYSLHNVVITLNVVFADLESELFSWEYLDKNKLLPKNLIGRLRGTEAQINKLDDSFGDLEKKATLINNAFEAAESLPSDLASLQEARKEIQTLIRQAGDDVENLKSKMETHIDHVRTLKFEIAENHRVIDNQRDALMNSAKQAKSLVNQCDDALQITTTQGLAAGFDQKASELRKSIWVWIIGLLIALGAGAFIGTERVKEFNDALTSSLTAGQAILHTLISVFSIGGPLWLAWISTQQINQRFKLSEDYSYKATVAKAFTGFNKIADGFDSDTKARLFNSTLDRLDEMPLRLIKGKDYNSPWHEFIDTEAFKNASKAFPNLASEAMKYAHKSDLKIKPTFNQSSPATRIKTNSVANEPEQQPNENESPKAVS